MSVIGSDETMARISIGNRIWLAAILFCLCAGIAGALWGWIWSLTPIAVLISLICIFRPTNGMYLLVFSWFLPFPLTSEPTFLPADILLFLVVIGFWLQRLRDGKTGLVPTKVDLPVVVWLGVLALSLVNVYDLQMGVVNWLRHLQLFLLFYAVIGLINASLSRRIIEFLCIITALFAVGNIPLFILAGASERIFGTAGLWLPGILSLVSIYATARLCFERGRAGMILYFLILVLCLFGLVISQSRGAILDVAIGIPLTLIIVWKLGNRVSDFSPRRRVLRLAIVGCILILLVAASTTPTLASLYRRLTAVGGAGTTLNFRFFLWGTALAIYAEHPFLGIGLGQVKVWHHIFPSLRLFPLGSLTFGLGMHLSFLKYLVETGTIGAIVLLWFLARIIQTGSRVVRRIQTAEQAGHAAGLLGAVLIIIVRSFYEGNFFYAIPGMTTVFFFGLLMILDTHSRSKS